MRTIDRLERTENIEDFTVNHIVFQKKESYIQKILEKQLQLNMSS